MNNNIQRCRYCEEKLKEIDKLKQELQDEKIRIHGILEVWSIKDELKNNALKQCKNALNFIKGQAEQTRDNLDIRVRFTKTKKYLVKSGLASIAGRCKSPLQYIADTIGKDK